MYLVEFRAPDEFEEVESPFATRPLPAARKTQRLRNKKNVFNRPFSAEPTVAPTVIETVTTRKSIGYADQAELLESRESELDETPIDYLEPKVEKKPARIKPRPAKKNLPKLTLLPKMAWGVIGLLVLRLICMDRGVYDYYATQNAISEKNQELNNLSRENENIQAEVSRIHLDGNYQRQLAKEHLGVIAADEFLILFAQDTEDKERDLNFL